MADTNSTKSPLGGAHPRDVMAIGLDQGELSEAMVAYFAKCEEKIGYVPNVLLAYAHSNAKLEAFAGMYNDLMLAPSGLTKLDREMIAVVVSAENRCWYCLVSHGAAVRVLSKDPVLGEALAYNYRVAKGVSAKQRAMLDFAIKMTRASAEITNADRDALRAAGWGEADLWDIIAVVGFYNMSNRMASASAMAPNPQYHAQAR